MIPTSLVTYPEAEAEVEIPLELRPKWEALTDEVTTLRDIENGLTYNHIPLDVAGYNLRYKKMREFAYRDALMIATEFPTYRERVRKLVDTIHGLKDMELPK